jgi:hypothetical protein
MLSQEFSAVRYRLCIVTLALSLGSGAPALLAQEAEPTAEADEPDHPYADLRESEDRTTQLLVDRYENLIKIQEWRDSTGKSRITAKYIQHDPKLQWVTLEMVKGSGTNRVTKEGTISLAKLNKTCQSRVKQIATLQKKLEELQSTSGDNPADAQPGDPGTPMYDEQGVEPEATGAASAANASENAPPARPPRKPAPRVGDSDFEVDPLGFAEVPIEPPTATDGSAPAPFN